MELTAGYQQTEVGPIPLEWQIDRVENLALVGTGDKDTQDRVSDGQYPFFVRSQTVERINSFSYDGEAVLTAGDGVGTGKVFHYINGKFDFHQRVYKISDFSERLNGYFFYLVFSSRFHSRIMQMTAKSSVDSVRREMIAGMLVPVPPVKEQRAIAAALRDVDHLIGALDKLIAKKRDLKQAAMQQLLTGRTRLPGFSGKWVSKQMRELFNFSGGLSASRDQLSETGHCYLHYGDIHLAAKSFIDVEAEFPSIPKLNVNVGDVNTSALLDDGDIVFVDASEDDEGTSKHIVVVNPNARTYIAGLHTIVAKPKANDLHGIFKRCCFQTRHIRNQFRFYAVGTKVSGISKSSIAKIELRYPHSRDEQEAIASVLSDMDAELSALEVRRDKTGALKRGMMQELLTGRIRLAPAAGD